MSVSRKVLLVTSKTWVGYNIAPSLGLYRLKVVLEEDGMPCDILDFSIDDEEAYIGRIAKGEYDVVGMSVAHINMEDDLDVLCKVRDAVARSGQPCRIVIGGQEATLNYEQWLKTGLAEMVFIGNAEYTFRDFCKNPFHGDVGSLEGVAYPDADGKMIFKPSPAITQEMFVTMSYANILKADVDYARYWNKVKSERVDTFNNSEFIPETVRLYTSSHCPRLCGFCSSQTFLPASQGGNLPIYAIAAGDVLDLVRHHIRRFGARAFLFSDDDFPIGNQRGLRRFEDFCGLLVEEKKSGRMSPEVKFFCQARIADFLDRGKTIARERIRLAKEAGFDSIGLGVETFSDNLLKAPSINKVGLTVDDSRRILDAFLEERIVPIIFIIVGIPESTEDEIVETMYITAEYIARGADVSVTARLRANPGSPITKYPGYEMAYKQWKNPMTGEIIEISDHYIPRDRNLRRIIAQIQPQTEKEIQSLKIEKGWTQNIMPKSLVGMCTLIATARLLDRQDVVSDLVEIMGRHLDRTASRRDSGESAKEKVHLTM